MAGISLAAPVIVVIGVGGALYGKGLLAVAILTFRRRGIACILVYSRSAAWEEHIKSRWLPRLGSHATTLNWSDHAAWPLSIEALIYRYSCRHRHGTNWNPAVIVLRGLRRPLVFRFYEAFQEGKKGRPGYLETLEQQMFTALGI